MTMPVGRASRPSPVETLSQSASPALHNFAYPVLPVACDASATAPTCDKVQIDSIDTARASEGLPPMALPSYYSRLTLPEQLLVVTDLERKARGLPVFSGLTRSLDTAAARAATAGRDPSGPPGTAWGSNWAGGIPTALLADFAFMYDDGPGSANVDCTHAGAPGCWEHRQNILGDYGAHPYMGAAVATWQGSVSITELFASNAQGGFAWQLPNQPAPASSPEGTAATRPTSQQAQPRLGFGAHRADRPGSSDRRAKQPFCPPSQFLR